MQKNLPCLKSNNYNVHNRSRINQKILPCRRDSNFCVTSILKNTKLYKKELPLAGHTLTYPALSMRPKKMPIQIESRIMLFEHQRKKHLSKSMSLILMISMWSLLSRTPQKSSS